MFDSFVCVMTSPSKPWRRFIRASLPLRLGETSAFTSRRFHLAAIAVMSPMAARAELSPPLERVTKRYAEKIQGAMDFLYFDIKPLVMTSLALSGPFPPKRHGTSCHFRFSICHRTSRIKCPCFLQSLRNRNHGGISWSCLLSCPLVTIL